MSIEKMISLKEILKDTTFDSLPSEHQGNVMVLLERINKVRDAYAKPMIVTSGYRSMSDHKRIYSEINAKRKKQGLAELRIPMSSMHLRGAAVDISDPRQELQKWCKANEALLTQIGLWMEDFSATKNWVHFQIFPPRSGKRWFLP